MGGVLKKSPGHEEQLQYLQLFLQESSVNTWYTKWELSTGAVNSFCYRNGFCKMGNAVLDPHMTLNVTTTSLRSHHVDASPCLGTDLWQAWGVLRYRGLSGRTLPHRMGWGTCHPTGKNLYPFYSINVSWSNVSPVYTCLDFLWTPNSAESM